MLMRVVLVALLPYASAQDNTTAQSTVSAQYSTTAPPVEPTVSAQYNTTAPLVEYDCDDSVNFIRDVKYSQRSLTDLCNADGTVCNANPVYVPRYANGLSVDGGAEYCKSLCNNYDACSPCTGFFFQRHTNGHEICGFYTIDLNDASLDKVTHGHASGSRICVKAKISVQAPDTFFAADVRDDPASAVSTFTQRLGWPACGANDITTNVTASENATGSAVRLITFRYDVSQLVALYNTTDTMLGTVAGWLQANDPSNVTSAADGRRRLTAADSSSTGLVTSCASYVCPVGTSSLSYPPAYCGDKGCCADTDCCTGGSTTCIAPPTPAALPLPDIAQVAPITEAHSGVSPLGPSWESAVVAAASFMVPAAAAGVHFL